MMIKTVINFLTELPVSAPVDTALLLITFIYALVASRTLYTASRRDADVSERMRHWQDIFAASARERQQKQRPSPAE
jgi:hypothetical protein